MWWVGALFLLGGVGAIRGFRRAVVALVLVAVVLFLELGWAIAYGLLCAMIVYGTEDPPTVEDDLDERDRRRARMAQQDRAMRDLMSGSRDDD